MIPARAGWIVSYHDSRGNTYPAIITATTAQDGYVHLTPFPPPGVMHDAMPEDGTPNRSLQRDAYGTWEVR